MLTGSKSIIIDRVLEDSLAECEINGYCARVNFFPNLLCFFVASQSLPRLVTHKTVCLFILVIWCFVASPTSTGSPSLGISSRFTSFDYGNLTRVVFSVGYGVGRQALPGPPACILFCRQNIKCLFKMGNVFNY